MSVIEKIKAAYEQKPAMVIIFGAFFAIFFIIGITLTINGFSGGKIVGDEAAKAVLIGTNSYGDMYYSGEITEGQLSGVGKLTIKNEEKNNEITMEGTFEDNYFKGGIITIKTPTDISSFYGEFNENRIVDGYKRFQNQDEESILYEGKYDENGKLNGRGSVIYNYTGTEPIKKVGIYEEGKLLDSENK